WLEVRSRWSKLRALGQSGLVRASVLTPVFGYLLLLNENVRRYLTVQFDSGGLFHYLPPMWRVWMLYYGSFSLAVGSILFAFLCPAYVKQYASAYQMVDEERPHRVAHAPEKISDELAVLYASMSKWEDCIFSLQRLHPELPNMGVGVTVLGSSDQFGL